MPIKIPNDLPARQFLEEEGLVVMRECDAMRQDIRPLRIALLNLMPQKVATETQIARLIGATPLQIELTLLTTASYKPTNISRQHMLDFYRSWAEVRHEKFDCLIITGAPIEKLPFEEVHYWQELTQILDWSQTNVFQSLDLCWGAQAALYHFHGVPKHELPQKMFGVFDHLVMKPNAPLLRGFTGEFPVPVSRHTEVRSADLLDIDGLEVLAESDEAGLCLAQDHSRRHIYMFNHLEYDAQTLANEYRRDLEAGDDIQIPKHYFPGDNPEKAPSNRWRTYAHMLISNWINDVYQRAPFEIEQIGGTLLPEAVPKSSTGR